MASAEKHGKFSFLDVAPIRAIPGEVKIGKLIIGRQEFSLTSLLELVRPNTEAVDPKRVVVDPISMLTFQYPNDAKRREIILELVECLTETGATCILSSELRRPNSGGRIVQPEEHFVQGTILMLDIAAGRTMEHLMQVEKMRGTQIDRQPRPYTITDMGIEIFSKDSVSRLRSSQFESRCDSVGVARCWCQNFRS